MAVNVMKDSIDIGLVTGNIEAMTTFYRNTLGLPQRQFSICPVAQR